MVGLCTKPSVVQATMNSRAWSALYMMIGREREEGPRHVNMDLMMTSDDRLVQEYANMCPGYLSRIANMKWWRLDGITPIKYHSGIPLTPRTQWDRYMVFWKYPTHGYTFFKKQSVDKNPETELKKYKKHHRGWFFRYYSELFLNRLCLGSMNWETQNTCVYIYINVCVWIDSTITLHTCSQLVMPRPP